MSPPQARHVFKLQFHVFAPAWASAFSWLFKLNLSFLPNPTPSNSNPDFPFSPSIQNVKVMYVVHLIYSV